MSVILRKRTHRNGKVEYRLDIYQFGKRRFESLGLFLTGDKFQNRETLKVAEVARAKRELEIQSSRYGIFPESRKSESFSSFVEQIGSQKFAEETKRNYRNAVSHLRKYGRGEVLFIELKKSFFEGFRDYLLKELTQNSAWKYLAIIKGAVLEAQREGLIPNNPAHDVRIKKVDTLPKFLTLEEVRLMAKTDCENTSVKNAFLFSCFSGLRYSDVVNLRWNNIENGCLTFTQQKTRMAERMFLSKQALKILESQRSVAQSERIDKGFCEGTVFYLPRRSTINKAVQRWASRAGVKKSISFHCARHTFATLSLTSNIDIYTVSKLLGHRNLVTTLIYAKVIDEKKREAVDLLPMI
ncbi:MAG TPA: site-specific integrase [Bacteroidota bacterium]|nr:site-specific integrase [Bacteroidota bacterium]